MSSVFDATRAVDAVTGLDRERHVNSVNGSSKAGPVPSAVTRQGRRLISPCETLRIVAKDHQISIKL